VYVSATLDFYALNFINVVEAAAAEKNTKIIELSESFSYFFCVCEFVQFLSGSAKAYNFFQFHKIHIFALMRKKAFFFHIHSITCIKYKIKHNTPREG
jgi:hypothetical protein